VGTHESLDFDSIQQCYQKIHQAVAVGLKKRFGLSVYLATCHDVGAVREPPLQCDSSPSFCFAVPVGYDIMASNRKLVGGAIRWTKRGMLYQGTLPLDRDFALLKEVIVPNRLRWLESLVNSSVSLNELLMGEGFDYQDISQAIVDGFRGELGWNLSSARGGF
jgi:lipoate-protein ligase A